MEMVAADGPQTSNGPPSFVPSKSSTPRPWACPFQKADPGRYSGCTRGWREVRRVKEHIYRKHKQIHCYRCHSVFDVQGDLNRHQIGHDRCDAVGTVPPVLTCGISQEAETQLKRRPKAGSDDTSRWFEVWTILFPDVAPPISPFVDEPPQTEKTAVASAVSAALTNFTSSLRGDDGLPLLVRQALADALHRSRVAPTRTGQAGIESTKANTELAVDVVMEGFDRLTRDLIQSLTETGSILSSLEPEDETDPPPLRISSPSRHQELLPRQIIRDPIANDVPLCHFVDDQIWGAPLLEYSSPSACPGDTIRGEVPATQWDMECPFDNIRIMNPMMANVPQPWFRRA